ncbi:MAG: hypothetical protein RIR70_648 [Pseudomonadota bacterium]
MNDWGITLVSSWISLLTVVAENLVRVAGNVGAPGDGLSGVLLALGLRALG